jgi:superfamily II DNA or RNA helicase
MSKTKKKLFIQPTIDKENIGASYRLIDNKDEKQKNAFLNEMERLNRDELSSSDRYNYLYPSLDDPNFNIKITERKEFFDTKMDIPDIVDIEKQADELCNADFELSPHQMFVRNFLSFETPYNSLLLYHGLGTGKTCSAISVAEEMRYYMKQMGITQRIIVVASPNVQENFKIQLFDERKLKLVDGIWNLRACTGNKYLKEINPMNMKGLTKSKVVSQIKRIINQFYLFVGYLELANMIQKKTTMENPTPEKIKRSLNKYFINRLIIIDEIHNIRSSDENSSNKRVATEINRLVDNVENLRLLFLSATPMFNNYKEIIWLINLMNKNDKRGQIGLSEVFDKEGNFIIDKDGNDKGYQLLKRKVNGYISFVKGENPLTFPFRIFPNDFSPDNTFQKNRYPSRQINGKNIVQPLEHVNVFLTNIGRYQNLIYNTILDEIIKKDTDEATFQNMDTFGYTLLQKPLMSLNMTYPGFREGENINEYFGKDGLKNYMKFKKTTESQGLPREDFEYKSENSEKIFSTENIGNYSAKIKNICSSIKKSKGIILIYSNYIDSGVIPVALALEQMGFSRYGSYAKSLFKTPPTDSIDAIQFKTKSEIEESSTFFSAKYVIISGDKTISPNNREDVIALTNEDNKNGEKVKVVIISKAGSEGLDFKNIRQIHILEPWYNMNLIEQIIGRGVRNKSHCALPFKERNVLIYLYSTLLESEKEAVDLYIYRIAELKAIQVGRVTRLLKESAVDCLLNIEQNKFNADFINEKILISLSNNKEIQYAIGDKPYSAACDYLESCSYICKPDANISVGDTKLDTYDERFIIMNSDKIIMKIKDAFKEHYFYTKENLVKEINVNRIYPIIQINAALTQLINDKSEFLTDEYGRLGHLINIDRYYLFQPVELENENESIYDKSTPIPFKRSKFVVPLENKKTIKQKKSTEKIKDKELINKLNEKYQKVFSKQTIQRGESDYYMYCSKIFENFKTMGFQQSILETLMMEHLLQSLLFNQTVELLNYLYYNIKLSSFEEKMKQYYDKFLLKSKNIVGLLLSKNNKQHLMIMNTEKWTSGEAEDYRDLLGEIERLIIKKENMSKYVGFMTEFKKEYMIFKIIDSQDPKSKGARCDQATKSNVINLLNLIIGEDKYTKQNTKGRHQTEFCVLQEFILRYFNYINKENKVWFVSPIEAVLVFN